MSYVGKFNFNWMTNYIYADDAAPVFPKGTVIQVSAWYDNTKANPNNPDPDQWVGYGDRTVDEMAHAWMNVVYLTDAEYKAAVTSEEGASDQRRRPAAAIAMRHPFAALALLASAGAVLVRALISPRGPADLANRFAASAPASPPPTKAGSTTPTARTAS